jgi:hypothetical protein
MKAQFVLPAKRVDGLRQTHNWDRT